MVAIKHKSSPSPDVPITIIEPPKGIIPLNLRELWQYREMMVFFIWRDLKVRYRQTVLGLSWAIIQPFVTMIVFSFVFGALARMPSDGVPYPIFSYIGLLPWTFFANGLTKAASSTVSSANLIRKIYFPRLILPLTAVAGGVVDLLIGFSMVIVLMAYYVLLALNSVAYLSLYALSSPELLTSAFYHTHIGFQVTANLLWLPALLLLAFVTALGIGLWAAALNVRFRDVGHAMSFFTRILLYLTPVAYPTSALPEAVQWVAALNPMTGVVEGFRWAVLGVDTSPQPFILISALVAVFLLISGAYFFRSTESTFADLV